MIEFKGTKGEWEIITVTVKNHETISIANEQECKKEGLRLIALISPADDFDERDQANAQLISCAPEMLEMLERLAHGEVYVGVKEIRELIIKATKL